MRLSWNEIRARAACFAEDWKTARYENGESQTLHNEFFGVFGIMRRRVARFEEPVKRLGDERGFIELFWKRVLPVEQKSAGWDLIRAKLQALDHFPSLKENGLPRYIVVADFQTFELDGLPDKHRPLDDAVDKFYRSVAFTGDRDRVGYVRTVRKACRAARCHSFSADRAT
ncbi:MAG: type IIL restriction-modification enzyme MmeI [Bryobacteraceae bacterium]